MHGLQQDCAYPNSCVWSTGETPMAERVTQTMVSARMTMSLPSKLPEPAHPMHQHFAQIPWIMFFTCLLSTIMCIQPKSLSGSVL